MRLNRPRIGFRDKRTVDGRAGHWFVLLLFNVFRCQKHIRDNRVAGEGLELLEDQPLRHFYHPRGEGPWSVVVQSDDLSYLLGT